jgi:hypothetical protein
MHATAVWVSLLSGAAALPQLFGGGLPFLGAAPLPVTPVTNPLGSIGSVAAPLTKPLGSIGSVAAPLSGVAPLTAPLTNPLGSIGSVAAPLVAPLTPVLSPQVPSAYSVSGAIYLGFFISFKSVQVPNLLGIPNTIIQQLLTGPAVALPNLTWQTCSAYCAANGFRYAGVEGGNTCRCGSAFGFTPIRALDTVCGLTCSGSASQCCGALNRLVLFQILSPATVPSSQPAASATPRPSSAVAPIPSRPSTPAVSSPAVVRPIPASPVPTVGSSKPAPLPSLPVPASIRPSSLPAVKPVPLPSPVPAPAPSKGLPVVPLPSLSVVPAILRQINSADVCIARLPTTVRQAILTSCFS